MMMRLLSSCLAVALSGGFAYAQPFTPHQQLAREIYKELVDINTTDSVGNTTLAAEAMARRLRRAGFPEDDIHVLGSDARKGNLVTRLRGTGARRPILLLAHLDVVEARREDWSFDPFKFQEQDGYFLGRGTSDDKAMAAIFVANLLRYKQEGFVPDRDIILALTADEEMGDVPTNGVSWLLKRYKNLIDAEFALNEGGGISLRNGKPAVSRLQVSEKISVMYRLEVKNPGGHSAVPTRDNAIYHLAEGLRRLVRHAFPVKLTEATRAYFERLASIESGQDAEDMRAILRNPADLAATSRLSTRPSYNAQLRTTCVATRLDSGIAKNALPQTARATVNCRVLPGESVAEVQQTLVRVLANDKIVVSQMEDYTPSLPSPPRPDLVQAIERLTAEFWPGAAVVPVMSTGATDSRFLRNAGIPAYGHSGLASEPGDNRAHGKDERLAVKSFFDGLEYQYRLVKALSSPEKTMPLSPLEAQ
ncbi:MAG TPA: M20/M25/M40 family metallo-hydrolase [Candidatus Binatia bacterium]|jgi:acetylornithine deacetylase/succinyl-diaminopimelate desuccinylase-like protein